MLQHDVRVARSLGRVLARCVVVVAADDERRTTSSSNSSSSSAEVIKPRILPQLRGVLASGLAAHITHLDLSEINIMVSDAGDVTGLVDWELSPPPSPFGMGCCRIQSLAGQYSGHVFRLRTEYHEMERGFWADMVARAADVGRAPGRAVQISVAIGTVLDVWGLMEVGRVNDMALRALPTF
ncbi:MAG: hypothetical protein M1826_000128 [Phylliscum demangeonii]|nr:MAG: hypothetical protein M1826_000128 [Phylliscum demangeonii]